jgi:hypothetical protein
VGTRGKGTTGSLIGFWGVDEWLRKRGKTCSILLLLDIEDFGIPSNVTSTSSCTQNRRSLYMCSSRLSSFAYRPLCPIIYITVSPLFLRSPPPPPRNYSKVDIDNRVASSHRRIVASHRISHYYVQAHEPAVPPRLYSSMYFCNSSLSVSLFSCRPSLPSPSYRPTSVYKHLPTIVSPSITDAIIHIMKPSMQSLIMPLIRTKSAGCRSNLVTH